jgi:hypothetical protein
MTGKDVYNVPEPYKRDTSDTCDYTAPQLALSTSGNSIIANIRRGSYDITGYTLYVDGAEKTGISLGSGGKISGYTLTGKEKNIRLTITDSAGGTATSEMTLTPTVDSNDKQTSDKSNH